MSNMLPSPRGCGLLPLVSMTFRLYREVTVPSRVRVVTTSPFASASTASVTVPSRVRVVTNHNGQFVVDSRVTVPSRVRVVTRLSIVFISLYNYFVLNQ